MSKNIKNPGTLFETTAKLLAEDKRPLAEISQLTGLSFYWLQKFKYEGMPDPSVNKVQTLYEALSGKPLELK